MSKMLEHAQGYPLEMGLEEQLNSFVRSYPMRFITKSRWEEPLFAIADAGNPEFYNLKEAVCKSHLLPQDLLPGAKSVVVYFLPFDPSIPSSNYQGRMSSKEWATAYIETNQLIADLNGHLVNWFATLGYQTAVTPATHNFDESTLLSDWSHRHVALIAGLGTLGLNRMLITEKGTCGRLGSFVTDAFLRPGEPILTDHCLYKSKGICKKCVDRCVSGALSLDHFDRHKCYDLCLENDRFHENLGLTDVCGKCLVNLPCSTTNPGKDNQ